MIYLGEKYDQGATCLPRNAAAERRLQSLALVDPRTARRLRITRAHTSTHCKDRVSARIVENGFKTVKLWLKQGAKGLFVKVLKQQGLKHKEKD